MARKYVRFNYFEVKLVPARLALEADLQELNNDQDNVQQFQADLWEMTDFLDYLSGQQNAFDTSFPVGDEYAEIEPDSYIYNEQARLYSFQLSKLRETNIPSKKRLGEIKEDILLNNDEYIGEFISIIYDQAYHVAMIQSNLYGLSTKQIESYLSEMRLIYLDEIGAPDEEPLLVRLTPIVDMSKVQGALEADYYRKIKIRGSDVTLDAVLNENSLLSEMRQTLMRSSGVSIELQISIGRAERTSSLDGELIRETIRGFEEIVDEYRKPKIELTMLENEEAEIEVVNLIEPRMTDRIPLEVEPRTTVAHEYLYQSMLHLYNRRRPDIRRVLGIVPMR